MKFSFFIYFCITTVTSKSFHGIGKRVPGDELIFNDTVRSSLRTSKATNHTVKFRHVVEKAVSYIELSADSNINAEYLLSFDGALQGRVTAINVTEFLLTISIYGLDLIQAPPSFKPILNQNAYLYGFILPIKQQDYDYEDECSDLDDFDHGLLEIGQRQIGDKLLYTQFKSSEITKSSINHSVTFRYIDEEFLTYAKFQTFDTNTAKASYSHITEHSIKALIFNENVNSLDVHLCLYGFEKDNLPDGYIPLLDLKNSDAYDVKYLEQKSENSTVKWSLSTFLLLLSICIIICGVI